HVLSNLGAFYLVNFVVAGGVFGIHYFLQSYSDVWNGILFTRSGGLRFELQIALPFIVAMIALLLLYYWVVYRSTERRKQMTQYLADVTIRIDEHESRCVGLIDTGNQLYDPLTRTPVMIVEATLWEPMLPAEWMDCIRNAEVEQIVSMMG